MDHRTLPHQALLQTTSTALTNRRSNHALVCVRTPFEHEEAVRVFRTALSRDIRRFIARAQLAAAATTPLERALINAMAVRYGRAEAHALRPPNV